MYEETHSRSFAKAASWRLLGGLITSVAVLLYTGRWSVALAVCGIEVIGKFALFFVHERIWNRIRFGRVEMEPAVLWFTGLSGAGKSTIAEAVIKKLQARGARVQGLDGDRIREFFPNTGYSRADRIAHVERVGFLARCLESNGIFAVASLVSPYRESRDFVRRNCRRFVEIHVSTPLAECERRDVKGLYAKARRGEIQDLTGVGSPYEAPIAPEITINTAELSLEEAVKKVMHYLDSGAHSRHGEGWSERPFIKAGK